MHIDPKEGHPEMDYAEHLGTYKLFCGLFLWGTLACVAIVAAMGLFLT
ncbi:aa3-type cytochrome c oxidase subunit IV [Methyloceanibacter stevinii]|nr:aa3-type cytochrome c oxidase subunit IV [Methyloceanibacter stevinii]